MLLLKRGTHLGFNMIKMLNKTSLALKHKWNQILNHGTDLGFNAIRVLRKLS